MGVTGARTAARPANDTTDDDGGVFTTPRYVFLPHKFIFLTNNMFFKAEIQPKRVRQVPEPPPVHVPLPTTPWTMAAGSLRPQGMFFYHINLFF